MNERWARPIWLPSTHPQPAPSQSLPTAALMCSGADQPCRHHVSNRTSKQKRPALHSRRTPAPHPMPNDPHAHLIVKRKPVPPAPPLAQALSAIHIVEFDDHQEPDPVPRPSHPLKSVQNQQIMLRSPLSVSSTSSLFELSSPSSESSTSSSSTYYKRQSLPPENTTRHQYKPHKLNRIHSARPEPSDDDDDDDNSSPEEDPPPDSTAPTFWNPRPGPDIGAPLRRNFSKRLKGLLQPHKPRIEGASKDQHAANRLWSVDRPKTPIHSQPKHLNPFRILSNTLPVADQISLDFDQEDFAQIDTYTANVNQRGPMLTPTLLAQKFLARPYRRPLHKARSLFVWIAQNIVIDPALPDAQVSPDKILAQRTCSVPLAIANLFVDMANAIDIEAQVVFGYLRGYKDTMSAEPAQNHAWCAVKVEGEYRFVDCWLASPYYHANNGVMEAHWFLSSPLDMIYTHFPANIADQYLEPPVSINTFFALPYVCIPFFRHHLSIVNCDLTSSDMTHITLQVDPDIACFAEVETLSQTDSNQTTTCKTRGLAQCLGDGNDRICKIKAVLPADQWMGWLKIYAGPRVIPQHGQQEKLGSKHFPLALCFRLTQHQHKHQQCAFDFVQLHACQYEFYVQEPQCYQLYPLQRYNFSVKSNHTHHKLAVRSPNGRLYKLTYYPHDHTYDGTLTVSEVGQWSLVCLLHHAGGLYVVASWECKA